DHFEEPGAPRRVVAMGELVVPICEVLEAGVQHPLWRNRPRRAQVDEGIRGQLDAGHVGAPARAQQLDAGMQRFTERALKRAAEFLLRSAQQLRAGVLIARILPGETAIKRPCAKDRVVAEFSALDACTGDVLGLKGDTTET